jgi:hypothetical protein
MNKGFHIRMVLLVFVAIIHTAANAEVFEYVTPEIPASKDFQVWVNGEEIFTGQAGSARHGFYSFSIFDFTGSVDIRVKSLRAIKWLDILPSSFNIPHNTIDDYSFEFRLETPRKLTFLVNNDRLNALHLLTGSPEESKPDPDSSDVLYYKAGQVYDIGVLDLKDNQTLYIEGGARLKGMVRVRDASNVKILGRGMIDGSDNASSGNGPDSDDPWRLIYMENSENIHVEGITLFNSRRWTFHPYQCTGLTVVNIRVLNWSFGSDGTDISSCQDVKISNSFYRTNDDCIVVKALSFSDKMYYPNPRIQNMDAKNIRVENCIFWNMPYGNVLEIGFELRCERVENIRFENCDVIMSDHRGAVFSIHNSDNALVQNIVFDNIRVENADMLYGHKLFDVAILYSMWSYDRFEDQEMINKHRYNDAWDNLLPVLPGKEAFHASHRGYVRDIQFNNIQVLDGKFPYSVINGYDENHLVENVTFENISVQGKKIENEKELKLYTKFSKGVRFIN